MSTLLGNPTEPWPLSRAVDALGDAAKRGGIPGLVWTAGVVYPSLSISFELAQSMIGTIESMAGINLPGGNVGLGPLLAALGPSGFTFHLSTTGTLTMLLLLLVPFLALYRVVVGLARLSDPVLWDAESRERYGLVTVQAHVGKGVDVKTYEGRTVRLKEVWRAGKGLGPSGLGLWLVLLLLVSASTFVLLGVPIAVLQMLGLGGWLPILVGVLIPMLFVLLLYALVLQVVNQLALHSLAHNRRGVASALTHAWRLVRSAPASAARAAVLELLLFIVVLAMAHVPAALFGSSVPVLGHVLVVALFGFAGVTRAGFWARAYRDFGGLSAGYAVPGLK